MNGQGNMKIISVAQVTHVLIRRRFTRPELLVNRVNFGDKVRAGLNTPEHYFKYLSLLTVVKYPY
jgi:hypothetical protein